MRRPAAPASVALAFARDIRASLRVGVDAAQLERERAEIERGAREREAEEEAARERRREEGRRARAVDYTAAELPAPRVASALPDVAPLIAACGASLAHAGAVLVGGDLSALHAVVSELREREREARAFVDAWPADLAWSSAGRVHDVYAAAQSMGGVVGMAAYYLADLARRCP